MAIEYFELENNSILGNTKICLDAFADISRATIEKTKGVITPKKANDLVKVKFKNDELVIELSIKLVQGIDISKTCTEIQNSIYTAILEMTNVKCKAVNIDILGFVNE